MTRRGWCRGEDEEFMDVRDILFSDLGVRRNL